MNIQSQRAAPVGINMNVASAYNSDDSSPREIDHPRESQLLEQVGFTVVASGRRNPRNQRNLVVEAEKCASPLLQLATMCSCLFFA